MPIAVRGCSRIQARALVVHAASSRTLRATDSMAAHNSASGLEGRFDEFIVHPVYRLDRFDL
ncbi:MAG TPA: hypothetical protein VHX65_09235 [Pirellulales bacterium]|nr:hypothetical protein [Pirellulales bacterium]